MSTSKESILPVKTSEILRCYQHTAALKGAIELDLFTAIDEGNETVLSLADRCQAAQRGVRILCDYLVILELLTKQADRYQLSPEAAIFLSRRSSRYMGSASHFLTSSTLISHFSDVAEVVRTGGPLEGTDGTMSPEHPVWVDFARGMAPVVVPAAGFIADLLEASKGTPWKILDIAAGHGLFGITLAEQNPNAEVVALDWPKVLAVAQENARKAGLGERYQLLPGSAFEVAFGREYDLVLITNFFHHFGQDACVELMHKIHDSLSSGGRAVTLEFVPNEDRVSPPHAASFSLVMLVTTPSGDAYTFRQYQEMFQRAGFSKTQLLPVPGDPHQVLISHKR